MATRTTNYGLYMPDPTDPFEEFRAEHNENMKTIDQNLGGGGGGGSSSLAGLTDVDLTTLTDGQVLSYDGNTSKWVNGAVMFLSEYASEVYSNTEREVGCWIDGKPLYQKTISFLNQALVLGDNYLNLGISDIESVVHCKAYITNSAHTTIRPINSWGQSAGAQILYIITPSTGTFDIVTASAWTSPNIYITLLYTKTTDVAGSGKLVPSAMPAVHYSTTEQIIGTWIDGKPLYEIVVVIPNTSVINNAFTYPHGILNIEFARITNATTFDTSGNAFDLPLINNDGTNLGARLTATDIIFRGTGSLNVNNSRNLYITLQYTKTTD